jgi:hypothetical protein
VSSVLVLVRFSVSFLPLRMTSQVQATLETPVRTEPHPPEPTAPNVER